MSTKTASTGAFPSRSSVPDGSTTVACGYVVDGDLVPGLKGTLEWFEQNHLSAFTEELSEQ